MLSKQGIFINNPLNLFVTVQSKTENLELVFSTNTVLIAHFLLKPYMSVLNCLKISVTISQRLVLVELTR